MFIATMDSRTGTLETRVRLKPAHDRYWEKFMPVLRLAGPMLSDDGETRLGQVLLLDVADRSTAEDIVTKDPFFAAGLFTDLVVRRFRVSVESTPVR
jgi:uncharacterized protein YciI